MILKIIDRRPAIVREDGSVVFHSIYTGNRYWGSMYNVLTDFREQSWSVREESFKIDKDLSPMGEGLRYFIAECENSTLYAVLSADKALLRTETVNTGDDKNPFDVIALGGMYERRFERCLYHGINEHNGIRAMDMSSVSLIKKFCENDYTESAVHLAAIDCEGEAVNFGYVSFDRYWTSVFACEGGTVEFRHFLDGRPQRAGEKLCSDWMLISFYDDMVEGLPEYARFIHDFNSFKNLHTKEPVGFCTWYYYMGKINERTVYENLEKCKQIKDILPLDVFQIDAGWGWHGHHSEWNAERFPEGMKYYADLIKEAGMTPGLWTSPFDYNKESDVVREHPEWFVHYEDGSLAMRGDNCMLDVTHPGAAELVREKYRRFTYDWGYRYLKIDIVSDYMTCGVYHEKDAGALQNVREYFRLAREASHPDTFILGCTSPLFEIAEHVDGVRVALDIFERWESLLKEFNRIFKRYYMNGTLFVSDPDCLMIRKAENEDADCHRFCTRTDEEIHTFLVAMYAAGGTVMISDKLPLMEEKHFQMYKKLLPVNGRVGKPLDLMDSFVPGILDMGEKDGRREVALINWGERERTFTVKLDGTYAAHEHFTEEDLGTHTDVYSVTLQPHHSQLVVLEKLNQ